MPIGFALTRNDSSEYFNALLILKLKLVTNWNQFFAKGLVMKSFLFCLLFISSLTAFSAERFQGLVTIAPERALYVDWIKAKAGRPTIIVLNGLTYSTRYWDPFVQAAEKYNFGIFRYDPRGMGKTLLQDGIPTAPILIDDQARDLNLLTRKMGLTGKLNLLGLSYGGGLANAFVKHYASRVERCILMAPFTEPMESQDNSIKQQIIWTRISNPMLKATDDELYGYFLRQSVYTAYPLTEPSMYEHPWKFEGVYQLTEGIRKFRAIDMATKFPAKSVHMMVAEKDQYIPQEVLEKFWNAIPKASRASRVLVLGSEHKIPESRPEFAAAWVNEILSGRVDLTKGTTFAIDPRTNPENPLP